MAFIQVDSKCFSEADKDLLNCFCEFHELPQLNEGFNDLKKKKEEKLKNLLRETLDRNIEPTHKLEGSAIEGHVRDHVTRRKWRKTRIKLYENLIILALGVKGESQDLYFRKQAASEACKKLCDSNLERRGSIYAYLVDQIHDDEDILFKHYDSQKGLLIEPEEFQAAPGERHTCPGSEVCGAWTQDILRKILIKGSKEGQELKAEPALWLVVSIDRYRVHFFVTIWKAMDDWPEDGDTKVGDEPLPKAKQAPNKRMMTRKAKQEDDDANARARAREKDRKELLRKASEAFKDMVSSFGTSWTERSWRNRARLYWLLGLVKHTPLPNEQVRAFKSFDYVGPIGYLLKYMIEEDGDDMLLGEIHPDLRFHYNKAKYDDKGNKLGTLRICSLLAWASAVDDCDLVEGVLKHNRAYIKTIRCGFEWEENWKEYWAHALWNAAYRGHEKIVKELLSCDFPYHEVYFKYYSDNSMEPPLHVAVRQRYVSAVEAFCCVENVVSKNFNCHQENAHGQTPLEVSSSLEDLKDKISDPDTKRKIQREIQSIQSILLQRPEVNRAVEELCKQREMTVGSANTIMVGATLIAGITFGGWLSPPLSYHSYYQYPEPQPAPPNSYDSYMAIEGHSSIQVFAIFNSLSFFFAIAALLAGMETACFIKAIEDMYIAKTVTELRKKLKWTTTLFIASVLCVLVAFGSAGIAILPPIKQYQTSMYCTIGAGGFVSLLFICRVLLFCISKSVNKGTTDKIIDPVKKWIGCLAQKFKGNLRECFKTKPVPTDPKRSTTDSNLLDRDSSRLVDS